MTIELHRSRAVTLLPVAFVCLVLLQYGLQSSRALADSGMETLSSEVAPDAASDRVAATEAEFRVDESGAATYSIPLYSVPGTAGVTPQLSLNYSSQGGYGVLGKGWSIGGVSAIGRCRATREAGDFISGGAPVDGNPSPINYTATDRYCLDGQRLIPGTGGAACPTVSGMSVQTLRTEIESFQRVCAYTPTGGSNGPAFFTVNRKDGSTSWYGNRSVDSSANRPDGYVETNALGHTGKAFVWAQTRFQDSAGNYIDYTYLENPGTAAGSAEHLLQEVRYTGKNVLTGQSGSALTPYAKIVFNYSALPSTKWGLGYQSGGSTHTQRFRLTSITSCASAASGCAVANQARHYVLTYAASASGSAMDQLIGLQECRDSTAVVCAAPTMFEWSLAKHEFATIEKPANLATDTSSLVGFKQGDIDGDGRPDFVYLRGSSSGCATNWIVTGLSRLDASGRPTFEGWGSVCLPADISQRDDGAWHLVDYDGDGRDDLLVAGASGQNWRLYRSTGTAFSTSQNLIADVPFSPSTIQLADLNGDGLIDIVYVSAGVLRARLMARQGSGFAWGSERQIQVDAASLGPTVCDGDPYTQNCERSVAIGPTSKTGFTQLADFNGDASSDLLFVVTTAYEEWTFEPECESGRGSLDAKADPCWQHRQAKRLHAMTVEVPSTGTIIARNYGAVAGDAHAVVLADFNGDGLTDVASRLNAGSDWDYRINIGRALMYGGSLPLNDYRDQVRFADVNGDGRTDMLHVAAHGSNKAYYVRYAQSNGGFAASVLLPGGNARTCEGSGCNPSVVTPLFADFDGDGQVDFMSLRLQNNPTVYVSRGNSRHVARDVITRITDGFGAQTNIVYAPLTNKDLYRRDTGARGLNWGRGAPVMDLLAPIYTVARVTSSSPQAGASNAMATVHYRYAGAKVQAGGRGFLGFGEIRTVDSNQTGGFVTTTTAYHQNFPYVGMPYLTIKRALPDQSYSTPACLSGTITNSCFATPGQGFPSPSGSWFSESQHEWEADTDLAAAVRAFAAGEQRPVHVRTLGTVERLRDPSTGSVTSRVETTFDYGAYGDVILTGVDTKTGGGTLVSSVTTANTYNNDATRWKLGRLTASTVMHVRPSRGDVVRKTSFAYDMGSGSTYTGLLVEERVQPSGTIDQALITRYTRDDYGNVIRRQTCSLDELSRCDHNSVPMRTEGATVNRYQRTYFDSRGRFTTRRYAPFTNLAGGGSAQYTYVNTVQARDVFGQAIQVRNDLTGAHSLAVNGELGRAYYSWAETVPGSTPGDPAGGVGSTTSYRWCGGSAPCPSGAKFYRKVLHTAAPTTWTYFDALGRPILDTARTFNADVAGMDVSGVCTAYDAAGRPVRISNPFFLPETATSGGYPKMSADICTSSARKWTTTTYDVLGRPTRVTGPDASTAQTAYTNLSTTVTDPRGKTTTETRNALGEVIKVTDALGTDTVYSYHADGTLSYVHRDAGRGQIRNTFTYDELGRKIRQVDPDGGTTQFEYNALGELIAQQHADGSRIENAVDAQGRVWRKIVKNPGGTVETQSTYTFDTATNGLGQLASETIAGTYAGWQGQSGTEHRYNRSYRYDSLGRPSGTTTIIDGTSYPTETVYDARGRVFKQQDASGRWVKHDYSPRGMLRAVCNYVSDDSSTCSSSSTYLRLLETDARGNMVHERRGNSTNMDVTREYWADTGRIAGICAGNATTCHLMDEGYAWDRAGNLSTHMKETRYLETFTYDNLNRLSQAKLSMQNGVTVNKVTQFFEYDVLGNICHKAWSGGSANYTYRGRSGCGLGGVNSARGGGGTGSTGPHQASQMGSDLYYYDGRGEQTLRDRAGTTEDRFVSYSADDKPYQVDIASTTAPVYRSRFWYGPDGQRYKAVHDQARTVLYLGNVEIVKVGAATTYRRNIAGVVLQTSTTLTGPATDHYLFHDQLGSLVRVTNASGALVKEMDYDAQGGRRSPDDATTAGGGGITDLTYRGFTNHEQFGRLEVIHMNARIYDPGLGRFLQPDPVIQAPGNLQGWNAYTYVFNNPLAYTDPTGMIGLWIHRNVHKQMIRGVMRALGPEVTGVAVGVGCAFAGPFAPLCYAGANYDMTRAFGGSSSQALKSGVIGAFSSYVGGQIGTGSAGQVFGQAMLGGVVAELQGGKFGHGFVSAGVTTMVMPQVGYIQNDGGRIVVGAIVGGTISSMTGGKFANGAATGAFQAAMMGGGEGKARTQLGKGSGDGTEGAPESLKSVIRDPKKRDQFLNELADHGWAAMAGTITYEDRYYPLSASTAAITTRNGTIFYRRAFEHNYYAILSIMDHEYAHYWQIRSGMWNGVKDYTPEAYALELKAYDTQIGRYHFELASEAFRAGTMRSRSAYENSYFLSCKTENCSGLYP